MDARRLDTGHVLAAGILNIPAPETDIPKDRETFHAEGDDWSYVGTDAIIGALESGKLIEAPNYYGIPAVWKVADGVCRGILLQYRAVTESPTFATVQEAESWFQDRYHQTNG